MSKLKVLICEVDSENENKLREIASFDVQEMEMGQLKGTRTLDELETRTDKLGQEVKRKLLQVQWQTIDKTLSETYRQRFPP